MALDKSDIDALTKAYKDALSQLGLNSSPFGMNEPSLIRPDNDPDANTPQGKSNNNFVKQLNHSAKILKDYTEHQHSYAKGIARGIPVVSTFVSLMEKNSTRLEHSIMGQSDALKKGALSMEEFSNKVKGNSDKLSNVAHSFDYIEKALNEITKNTNEHNQALARYQKAREDHEKAVKNSNEEEKKNAKNRIEEEEKLLQKIEETRKKNLNEIRDASRRVGDPKIREQLEELTKNADENNDELIKAVDQLKDYTRGASAGLQSSQSKLINLQRENTEKISSSLQEMGRAVAIGITSGIPKELNMILRRQALNANQSQFRAAAADAGMSEEALLTLMDSNRFTMKSLAEDRGFSSETEFIRSSEFREFQQIGREFGLMGEAGAKLMLEYADSLRKLGITESNETLKETMLGFKRMQKDLGMTQEEVMQSFNEYAETGFMRLYASGPDQQFAGLEAMREEIENRETLAKALNIESKQLRDIQRDRVSTDFGDVGNAIRAAIKGEIVLSEYTDFNEEEMNLMRRGMMGESMNFTTEEHRQYEELILAAQASVGKQFAGEVGQGGQGIGGRAVMYGLTRGTIFADLQRGAGMAASMEGADITDPLQIDRELIDSRAQSLKDSADAASEMSGIIHKVVTGLENLRGALDSSVGQGVAAAGSSIMGLIQGGLESLLSFGAGAAVAKYGVKGAVSKGVGLVSSAGSKLTPAATRAPLVGTGLVVGNQYLNEQELNRQVASGEISQEDADIEKGKGRIGVAGRLAGAWMGAKAGTLVGGGAGTIALPVVGTVGGAALGGLLGGIGGFFAGGLASDTYANSVYSSSEQNTEAIGGPPSQSSTRTRYSSNYAMNDLYEKDPELYREVFDRKEELKRQYFREAMQQFRENNPDASPISLRMEQSMNRTAADMKAKVDTDIEYMDEINQAFGDEVIRVVHGNVGLEQDTDSTIQTGANPSPIQDNVIGGPASLSRVTTEYPGYESDTLTTTAPLNMNDIDALYNQLTQGEYPAQSIITDNNRKQIQETIDFLSTEEGGDQEMKDTMVDILRELLENNKETLEEHRKAYTREMTQEERAKNNRSIQQAIDQTVASVKDMTNNRLQSIEDHVAA